MQYRHLGRSGLKVSPLCLGTMNFGPLTTEPDSFAIMDKALESGVNFFDTADVYGWKRGEGITESIVGRWFAQGGERRERVILATKVFGDMDLPDRPDVNFARGLSASKIVRECERSLKRLQADYIDLYQMHHIDREVPVEEVWQAFETLNRQGKVHYVGSSNFAGWDIATYNQVAKQRNFLGLVSEQSVYNLDNRMVELEVVPACRHYGLGIIPWSPLGGGLLAGALEKQAKGRRAAENFQKNVEKKRDKLQKYEDLCRQLGESPANVGLTWLLSNPVVTAPIIGPRTMEQLTGALKVPEMKLSPETLKALDEIFPARRRSAQGLCLVMQRAGTLFGHANQQCDRSGPGDPGLGRCGCVRDRRVVYGRIRGRARRPAGRLRRYRGAIQLLWRRRHQRTGAGLAFAPRYRVPQTDHRRADQGGHRATRHARSGRGGGGQPQHRPPAQHRRAEDRAGPLGEGARHHADAAHAGMSAAGGGWPHRRPAGREQGRPGRHPCARVHRCHRRRRCGGAGRRAVDGAR